mgnify:CR=1 FL=1
MHRLILALCAAAALVGVAAPAQAQSPAVGVRLVADGMTSPIVPSLTPATRMSRSATSRSCTSRSTRACWRRATCRC